MKLKVERFGGTRAMSHTSDSCAHCGATAKCRRRDFSEQAWSALVAWGEIQEVVVDQGICESCYAELREVLIDRAEELLGHTPGKSEDRSAASSDRPSKTASRPSDAGQRGRVRKAG